MAPHVAKVGHAFLPPAPKEAWGFEFESKKVSKGDLPDFIFGALEGPGTPWETSCKHWGILRGLWRILGSILEALRKPLGSLW